MYKTFLTFPKWLRLAIIFPILFLNGWLLVLVLNYFRSLVTFVIIANLLAFLLELAVKLLQKEGMKRGWAITLVLLSTLFIVFASALVLIPLIVTQLSSLLNSAPQWLEDTQQNLDTLSKTPILTRLPFDVGKIVSVSATRFYGRLEGVGSQVLGLLAGTIGSFFNSLIVLVFTIFLLIGGQKFWDGIFSWLPAPWDKKIPLYTQKTFKDYFFSRLILCVITIVALVIAFILLNIPYSILFAFALGVTSLIPIAGGILGFFLTILLCFNELDIGIKFFISNLIVNQIVDNVLSPKLMGDLIGLNPIWLLISLFIGAQLGGVLGLLLAVPVASVIKQIIDDLRVTPTEIQSLTKLD
ncbi:AI-2E family transporter [Aphanothece hegewaldii CCALA 016]|uniref:AI-2E family transporter n=1 Tax=Aphanothece hegewaldii CCALA 016 TaxID=2107694 RepID=A0A2T1LV60_9CHRO|nr:AI-2E family transporter [Aphanothece hegewaldii]PSF35572.1 AI-2E family transporter [Aphanothece hegewaldii CCALA 016]